VHQEQLQLLKVVHCELQEACSTQPKTHELLSTLLP
jgi:hypothetical protein